MISDVYLLILSFKFHENDSADKVWEFFFVFYKFFAVWFLPVNFSSV